jgi:hypothetical protein
VNVLDPAKTIVGEEEEEEDEERAAALAAASAAMRASARAGYRAPSEKSRCSIAAQRRRPRAPLSHQQSTPVSRVRRYPPVKSSRHRPDSAHQTDRSPAGLLSNAIAGT